jgi:hypothetical protein
LNASLRRRHRVAWIVLALLVPPAFAAALAWRPALPPPSAIPAALRTEPGADALAWERDDLWPELPIRTRLLTGGSGPVVELVPLRDPMKPDVLIYWAAEGTADRVPDGARLLGRLSGVEPRRLVLPPAAQERAGRLYLYSLGHGELVDTAALPPGLE